MNFGSRNKVDPSFNMSSMTDLVFLLLIFFIIVSTMVNPFAIPVDLPNGSIRKKNPSKVSVSISSDLTHYVSEKKVKADQVENALMKALGPKEEGVKKSIMLNVDKSVPTGIMANILVIAHKNGWGIAMATKPK